MIHALEHVSIAVPAARLAEAARDYETLLGWRAQPRPAGCSFQLSNVRLELVADAAAAGLAGLAFAVEDLAAWGRLLARGGLPVQPANLGKESARPALLADRQATYGVPINFCAGEKEAVRPSAPSVPEAETTAVAALDHVVIKTPNPDRAIALYAGRLGLSLRLDRSYAEWGARLLFFRCGALTVELVHRPGQESGEGVDRLWGLSWRVPDIAGAHGRLREARVDLSEVRRGRRPGTRVATVRSHTAEVATLLLGPDAGA
jgi:catechol 2,3-dioxygenase-like lactoylglutathione lyase family enzyme